MSTTWTKASPPTPGSLTSPAPIFNLADVICRLKDDESLSQQGLREMSSALNKISCTLGSDPSLIPAEPAVLRSRLSKTTAAMAGVSQARWNNIKSLTLKALKHVGLRSMPGRRREPLAPEWEVLRGALPDRHFQSGLSRFMSYCTAQGIDPPAVTAETFVQFDKEVENFSLVRDPGGVFRDTCKLWNRAAHAFPEWPQLIVAVPNRRRDFALVFDNFPPTFRADVEGFLSRGANPDVFSDSYHKPVAELTLRNRRQYILMAATALVRNGMPIERILGLDTLVSTTNAKSLLRILYERAGAASNHQIFHIVTLLKTIARHHLKLPEKAVDQLCKLCKALNPGTTGFTEKNRECLRQFLDTRKLVNLLTLPNRVLDEVARRDKLRRRDAVRVEFAVATGILLNIPLRADNLAGLDLSRHLKFVGTHTLLIVPQEETKNDVPVEAEFPPRLVEQLDIYIQTYRPLLIQEPTPWLFPGENGARRPSGGFAQQLSAFIAKEVGVVITAHQFRHLAAKLYLDRNPHDFETVRRLLGHKSIETTRRYYRELDSVLAGKRYAAMLDQLTADSEMPLTPHRPKRS